MLRSAKLCLLLLAALAVAAPVSAQTTRKHEIGSRAFTFHDKTVHEVVSTDPSAQARQVVDRIMSAIGLVANFEVRAAPGVANAQATVENGGKARYILYNPAWMEALRSTLGDNWPEISVLAHEIGHHLQFHMDADFGNHAAELQADFFSGFIMNKLGASLAQAQLAMAMISSEEASETHPARAQRVQEIARGWRAAAGNQGANVIKASLVPPSLPSAAPAPTETRVALLIGNTDYRSWSKLKNPKNDVVAIQRELRKLGFSTTTLYDGTAEQISQYLRLFREDTADADWALFYFAGSGVEIDGINYMVPIDADATRATAFAAEYPQMRLDRAFEAVRSARIVRLVVADACRIDPSNLPDSSNRPRSHLFKVVEPPHGVLVAYSTGAGQYAGDGEGDLSPYAQAMIAALRQPGIELDKVFRRVSAHVAEVSRGNQVPTVLGNWPPQDLYLTRK